MNPEKFYKIFKQKINDVLEGDENSFPPRMQIIVERWRLELTFYPDVMLALEDLILTEGQARGIKIKPKDDIFDEE